MPVAHGPCVGDLGLASELTLGLTYRIVGTPDAGGLRAVALGAGGDLKAAELLLGQRGLLVGVVLFAGEQTPEQARELARGGDDRHRVSTACADALIEGMKGTGLAHRRPARLHERVARPGRAPL